MDEPKITVELRPDQLADIIDAVLAFADDCANDREILQSMPRVDRDTVEDLLRRESALQKLVTQNARLARIVRRMQEAKEDKRNAETDSQRRRLV